MATAVDASSHSHASTAGVGSQSAASFSWSHVGASSGIKGVLVVAYVHNNGADLATSVTYGGVAVPAVQGGLCITGSAELGSVKLFYLGDSATIPQGTQTVVINRTNNAFSMFGHAVTYTGAGDTETFDLVLQGNGATTTMSLAELKPQNGSNVNSIRMAAVYFGSATVPATGANSTLLESNLSPGTASRGCVLVRETTAGVGARPVGVTNGTADDVAGIFFAVRDKVSESYDITFDSLLVPMTADSDTTTITAAILQAGSMGQGDYQSDGKTTAFALTGVVAGSLTKDALQTNQGPLTAVNVRNCGIVSAAAGFKTMGINHSNNTMYIQQNLPSGNRICTAAGCVYLDIPSQPGGSASLYDLCGFFGVSTGQFAMMQYCSDPNSADPVGSGFEIEANPTGTTEHSATIPVSTPGLYWFSFQADFTGGTASLYIYNYPAMTLVGSVTHSQITGEDIDYCRFGQGETGTASSHKSYMWFGLDYSVHTQPLKFNGTVSISPDMWLGSNADVIRRIRATVPSGIIGIKT
jgi:hypothetical protein